MKKRKASKRLTSKEKTAAVLIAALFIVLSISAFFLIQHLNPEKKETVKTATPAEESKKTVATPTAKPEAKPEEQKLPDKGIIVFMLDDAGNNLKELEPFLQFPGPLTIAVLPGLAYSKAAARRIREAGKTVFLHQPMEAVGGYDPGPEALYSGMSAEQVWAILEKNVRELAPISGMNNHQGSKITQDEIIMKTVLEFCKENNLVFIDSRTTSDTVVPMLANQMNFRIGERSVFLDNEQDKNLMQQSLNEGVKILNNKQAAAPNRTNYVLMIGHTWSPDLSAVLSENYSKLKMTGYTFSNAKDIVAK